MIKKSILLLTALLMILICIGCGANRTENLHEIDNPWAETADYPAAIMVNDSIYLYSHEPMSSEVADSAVIGYTSSYTDTFPEKNGETNFNRELNMPYAQVEGGIAVFYEGEWHLCVPKDK